MGTGILGMMRWGEGGDEFGKVGRERSRVGGGMKKGGGWGERASKEKKVSAEVGYSSSRKEEF